MAKYETYVLLVLPSKEIDTRPTLETIENKKFDSVEDILSIIPEVDLVEVYSLSDFMDWMNDHDDDLSGEERFKPDNYFFGYVQIKK